MDFSTVLDFLVAQFPVLNLIFVVLGALVVVGTVVDSLVDDKIDGGFSKKILAIPVLGSILNALKRFSPFNIKDKE